MIKGEMNVVFVWTGVTSYFADCWRELQATPGVNVKIFMALNRERKNSAIDICQGLDYTICYNDEAVQWNSVRESIQAFSPDMIVIVGWRAKLSRFVALDKAFTNIPKLLAHDMIFEWKLKKFLAPLVLHWYLKRFVGAFVPSDRTTFYSKFLGFSSSHIHRGFLSIDTAKYAKAFEIRKKQASYPRSFVFVGRYAQVKRLDVLMEAYKLYRSKVKHPWTLNCYGQGTTGAFLDGVEGVNDCGVGAANDMVDVYAANGAFVLASDYDPWPLVIAESVASGLPVVCTEACGSHADLIRTHYNGIVCGTNDAESIAAGMVWIHENEERLLEIGGRGMALVAPYSKEQWTENFLQICRKFSSRYATFKSG